MCVCVFVFVWVCVCVCVCLQQSTSFHTEDNAVLKFHNFLFSQKNNIKFWSHNLKYHFEDFGADERIIFKCICTVF